MVKDDKADCEAQAIAVIVHDGDSAGAVILCVYDEKADKSEIAEKLAVQQQNFWLTSLARDSKSIVKTIYLTTTVIKM